MLTSFFAFLGNASLLIPALIILFAQFAPESILPYAEYAPDSFIFNIAFYVAIACAVLAPLSIIKIIKADNLEEKTGVFRFIKYAFLALISAAIGLYLGYAGTVKGAYIFGNITAVSGEDSTDLRRVQITSKQINSAKRACPQELKTSDTISRPFYESYFYPSTLCATDELFQSVEEGENITLQGTKITNVGFFIYIVWTEKDIAEFKEATGSDNKTEQ